MLTAAATAFLLGSAGIAVTNLFPEILPQHSSSKRTDGAYEIYQTNARAEAIKKEQRTPQNAIALKRLKERADGIEERLQSSEGENRYHSWVEMGSYLLYAGGAILTLAGLHYKR